MEPVHVTLDGQELYVILVYQDIMEVLVLHVLAQLTLTAMMGLREIQVTFQILFKIILIKSYKLIGGDGSCTCNTGWANLGSGTDCSICASGYYGESCNECPACGSHGKCNDGINGNGTCSCYIGWTRELCDSCDSGYHGANCTKCRDCGSHGRCNDGINGNGTCSCYVGWMTSKLETCGSCASGYYGNSCTPCSCPANSHCNDGSSNIFKSFFFFFFSKYFFLSFKKSILNQY